MKEPKIAIGQDLVQLVAEIDEFKGRWQPLKNKSPERLQQLRKAATVESVGSSTRIAGGKLTDAQVEALLSSQSPANDSGAADATRYAEAVELVFQSHRDLDLSNHTMHRLHRILLPHSAENKTPQGESNSPEMNELVRWATKSFDQGSMHPLLVAATFKVVFLAIHPFQDGNCRLSRILTTLLLFRAGYQYVLYSSLDSVLEKTGDYYHKALRRTQFTLNDESPDWQPWLSFFLRCLKKQKDNLAVHVEQEKTSTDHGELPPLSMDVLALLCQHRGLTVAQLAEMTGANQNTLKVRLRELVQSGHIHRHGKARATWYGLPH